ncbi:hypothetical protein THARTR1_10749 [Trichoderma harzianum]|uniref:Uncharacterized protein n=1 Tax=Trichoderma harzianum TaxID=5544 RepID=A0A2K0TLM7_TRIHA|nr:hypothetical protein THARTR1_10749 [Trichoderma harzianum]
MHRHRRRRSHAAFLVSHRPAGGEKWMMALGLDSAGGCYSLLAGDSSLPSVAISSSLSVSTPSGGVVGLSTISDSASPLAVPATFAYIASRSLLLIFWWSTNVLGPSRDHIPQGIDEAQANRDEDHDGVENRDDDVTLSDSSDCDTETVEPNISYQNNAVTWKDDTDQTQHADGIHLDIYLDTLTNTSLFKLHCNIHHKGSKAKGQKHTIFLFIHPESVRAITLDSGRSAGPGSSKPSRHTLSFSITQQPSLIIPKGYVLESKQRSKGLLNAVLALANVTDFTIHLNSSNITTPKKKRLELVARIFSPSSALNRPLTNKRCANLESLYGGRGGEVANLSRDVGKAPMQADLPPSYDEPQRGQGSNKRRRIDSDVTNDKSPAIHDDLFKSIRSHLDGIESRICTHIDGMEGRINTRLDSIEDRLKQLEDKVSDALDVDRDQYILEEIGEQLDDCITGVKIETEELFKAIDDRADMTMERIEQEVSERIDQLGEEVKDSTAELVEESLKKKLVNASLRIDGSVFLDI